VPVEEEVIEQPRQLGLGWEESTESEE